MPQRSWWDGYKIVGVPPHSSSRAIDNIRPIRCEVPAAPLLFGGVGGMPTITIARGVELNPNHF